MEEVFGLISFWIRMVVLSCILVWTLMDMIVRRALLADVRG